MPEKLRVLIVDDEELARVGLRLMLKQFDYVEIVAEAKDISTATKAILESKPDVVFLDIEFPGESGFDLLQTIGLSTRVVFVTAFDDYAIRAFDVNACDYLLKPVSKERLVRTLSKLIEKKEPVKPIPNVFKNDDSIYIQLNNSYYFIRVDSIIKISSYDQYTELLTTNGIKGLSNKHLYEWSECLPTKSFIQVHRSTIINLGFIEKIERGTNYSLRVKMKHIEKAIPISRTYLKQIKDIFSLKNK